MRCPYCSYTDDKVIDSRPSEEGEAIRRRRECLNCKKRFTTYEKIESMPLFVIKKDGSRQEFNREKLIKGILKSCEKRPVTAKEIENLVDQVELRAGNMLKREISTPEIGSLVLDGLRKIDVVAYVRFASVYRDFNDLESFVKEMEAISKLH